MSLDKGNVVSDLKDKNSLKEDEKKKIKDNEVSDEQLDDFNFEEFDKVIEKSFQDFLKDLQIRPSDDKESIQQFFNEWLDKQCETLDIMKESAIEQKIIGPVSFELAKDATKVELANLQQELLQREKIKTENDVSLKVGKENLKGLTKLYNNVKKEDIANLFDKNFDNRDHLLDLLKTSAPENIKKFQRIITGIDENDSSKDKDPETLKKLGGTGVDGMFGKHTMKTFQDYVSAHDIAASQQVQGDETETHNGDQDVVQAPNVTEEASPTASTVNPEGVEVDGKKYDEDVGQVSVNVTATRTQAAITGNPAVNPEIAKRSVPQNAEGELNVETQELSLAPGELETKLNEELKKIADNLPEIRVLSDGTKYNLYIPKGLGDFRAFNVAHSPEMTQYIKVLPNTEGVECFVVPANIKIGLKKDVITNTLVLGDYEIGNGFISLNSNSQVVGDPQKYSGDLNQASLKITNGENNDVSVQQVQGEQGQGELGEGEQGQNGSQESRNEYHNLEDDKYGEGLSEEIVASNYEAIMAYMNGEKNNNLIQAFQKLKINPNNIANALNQVLEEHDDIAKGSFTREHISDEAMNQLGRNGRWDRLFISEKNQLVNILNNVEKNTLEDFIKKMKVFNDVRVLEKTERFIKDNTKKLKENPFVVLSDFNRSGDLGRGDEGLKHDGRTSEQAMYNDFLSYADTEVNGLNKKIIDGPKTADLVQGFVSMIKSVGGGLYDDIEDKFAGNYTIENLGNYMVDNFETIVLYQQTLNKLSYNSSVDISNIISHKKRQTIVDNEMQEIKELSTNRDEIQKWFESQLGKDEEFNKRFNALSAQEQKNFIGNMAVWLDKGGLLPTIVKSFGIASKTNVTVDNLNKVNFERHVLKDDAGIGPRFSFGPIKDGAILHFDVPIVNLTGNFDLNHSAVENSLVHGVNPIYQLYTRLGANIGCGISFPSATHPDWEGYLSAAAEAAIGGKVDYKKGIELSSSNFGNVLKNQIFKDADFSSKEGFKEKSKKSIENIMNSTDRENKNLRKFMKNNKQELLNCIDNISNLLDVVGAFAADKKPEHKAILLDSMMKGIVEEVKNQNISELNGKTKLTRLGVFGQIGIGFDLKKLFDGDFKGAFGAGWSVGLETTISTWNMLYLPDKEKYEYMDAQLKSGESIKPLGEGIKTNNIENMRNAIAQSLSENSIPNIKVESNDKSQIEISVTDEVLQKYGKKNIYELFNIYVNSAKKGCVAISEDGKTLTMGGNDLENFSVATRNYFDDFAVYLMIGGKGIDGCGNNKINDETVGEYNTAGHFDQVFGFEFNEPTPEYKEEIKPLDRLFESYNELNSIFSDIEKKLSLMDNSEITNGRYAAFMNAAATENIQDTLDDSDYEAAFSALTDLLNGKLKDSCFDELRLKLNNPTFEEKVMIVDRFKGIFSYNYGLTNGKSLNNQIDGIGKRKGRGNKYKELYGYDGETQFPLTSEFDYRKAIQEKLNSKGTFKREPNPNLIGMTAFYRLGDKNAGRSYMMTELGGTNVLGGETIQITDTNDLAKTKEWFINNLKMSGPHKDILRANLSEKIKTILNLEDFTIPEEDLIPLLEGKDIDIGDRIIKIDMKYVFYLLGECANESIGMEFGSIIIKTKVEINEDDEGKDNVLEVGVDGQILTKTTSLEQHDVGAKVNIWGAKIGGSEDEGYGGVTHQEGTVRPGQGGGGSMSGGSNQSGHIGSGSGGGGSNTGSGEGGRP